MRILTVLFIFLGLIVSSLFLFSCQAGATGYYHKKVETIDGCQYVVFYDTYAISVIHKANCKNH